MKLSQTESKEKGFMEFFKGGASFHIEKLEGRRSSYLKELKIYFVIAILAIIAAPFASSYVTSALGRTTAEAAIRSLIYLFPITVSLFAILPVFRYRNNSKKIKVDGTRLIINKKISLKELVFNELLKFFGDFTFRKNEGVSLSGFQDSMILPEYDEYFSEDRISGVHNDTKIEISESKLITYYKRRRVSVFSGLLVVLDISNPSLILRAPFRGRTVIIQNDKEKLDYVKTKFAGCKKVGAPVRSLDKRFKIFTSNKDEAKKIVSKEFLESVIELSDVINASKDQITHLDDRIMFWAAGGVRFFSSLVTSLAMTLFSISMMIISLPWEILCTLRGRKFNMRFKIFFDWNIEPFSSEKHVNIYKKTNSATLDELEVVNEDIECSFYENKVLITIPYNKDLFEPNSIFKPALMEDDLHLFFKIMNMVFEITNVVCSDRENKSESVTKG